MALGEKDLGRDKNREADKEEKSRSKDKADKDEKTREERRRKEAREIEARSAREKISVIGASLSGEKNPQQPERVSFHFLLNPGCISLIALLRPSQKYFFQNTPKETRNVEKQNKKQIVATESSA